MSYLVSVFNKYKDGSETKLQFDTESVIIHEALLDAEIEVYTQRMHNGLNYTERPVFQTVALYPTLSLRR